MSEKTIKALLKGTDLNDVAAITGLFPARIEQIAKGDAITAAEAVALANHFKVDALGLLAKQAEAQLAALKYTSPAPGAGTPAVQPTPRSSSRPVRGSSIDL